MKLRSGKVQFVESTPVTLFPCLPAGFNKPVHEVTQIIDPSEFVLLISFPPMVYPIVGST